MTKRAFNFGQEFLRLFGKSVVMQGGATILLLGICGAMWLVPVFRSEPAGEIPPLLAALTSMVMTFWFKTKNASSSQSGSE